MTKGTLLVQASSSLQYYSYILEGFDSLKIRFLERGFPRLSGPRDGMGVVTPEGKRVFFATDDSSELNLDALEWADIYGKVNLLPEALEGRHGQKLVPLGPTFGTRYGSKATTYKALLKSSLNGGLIFAGPAARLKAAERHWATRAALSAYSPAPSQADYLFVLATYWSNHQTDNAQRIQAISELAQIRTIRFEGGLVPNGPHPIPTHLIADQYKLPEYLERTGGSVAAVNTRAVHGSLGWKLGEYFALGKAIITTPLEHVMPGGISHGKQVHVIDGSPGSWTEAVEKIARDAAYRRLLEAGARQYFDDFVSPRAIVSRTC